MQVRGMCESAQTFMQLVSHAESDAWLSMGLMFYLSVLPLSLQLTNFSGFLWSRTLQGHRAQRIEMLLLHEFHRRKFLLPDKPERRNDSKDGKRKDNNKPKESDTLGEDVEAAEAPAAPKSKGPQYAGVYQRPLI